MERQMANIMLMLQRWSQMLRYKIAVTTQQRKIKILVRNVGERIWALTMPEQQSQVFLVVGADVEEQSGTLAGPEAQGDIFCSQGHVSVYGWGQGTAAAPVELIRHLFFEDVADGCSRLKAGWNLWSGGDDVKRFNYKQESQQLPYL